ncbi:MAG: hypothetical protein HY722_00975 [Planctomycetes bacterium]|nr:hypothetical protein [Planctomycetota bacterium]
MSRLAQLCAVTTLALAFSGCASLTKEGRLVKAETTHFNLFFALRIPGYGFDRCMALLETSTGPNPKLVTVLRSSDTGIGFLNKILGFETIQIYAETVGD